MNGGAAAGTALRVTVGRARTAGCVLGLTVALGTLGACGDGRSVEAYCDTFYERGSQIRERAMEASSGEDPLAVLAGIMETPRQLHRLFADLAEVAPEEIRADVEILRDAYGEFADDVGEFGSDPLGSLFSGLLSGLATSGSERRVNEWTLDNCGPPPGTGDQ